MKLRLSALILSEFVNIVFPILIIIYIISKNGMEFYGGYALIVTGGTFLACFITYGFQNLSVVNLKDKKFSNKELLLSILIYRILAFFVICLLIFKIFPEQVLVLLIVYTEVFSIKWYLFANSKFENYFIITLSQRIIGLAFVVFVSVTGSVESLIWLIYIPQLSINIISVTILAIALHRDEISIMLNVKSFTSIVREGFWFFVARLNAIFSEKILIFLFGLTDDLKMIATCDLIQRSTAGLMAQNNVLNQYLFPILSEQRAHLSNAFFGFASFILCLVVIVEIEVLLKICKMIGFQHALLETIQKEKVLILAIVLLTSLSHNFGNLVSLLKTNSQRFLLTSLRATFLYASITISLYLTGFLNPLSLLVYPAILFGLRLKDSLKSW